MTKILKCLNIYRIERIDEMVITDYNMTYDNISRYPYNVVPNIVHYVLLNIYEIQFSFTQSKTDQIIVHCDCNHLVGNYHKRILKISAKSGTKITIRRIIKPKTIE